MIRNLINSTQNTEEQIFKNLQQDLGKHSKVIEKSKKFGIRLPDFVNVINKNVYIYFSQLSNRKQLSGPTLEWMADFAQTSPYQDIRDNYHNQGWAEQYRKLKKEL